MRPRSGWMFGAACLWLATLCALPVAANAGTAAAADRAYRASWSYHLVSRPRRLVVRDGHRRPLAVFTYGARTVNVRGPARRLAEPATTDAFVVSHTRVRLLPEPFTGHVPVRWLRRKTRDSRPDALAIALQFVTGAPTVRSSAGRVVSSDASYGPLVGGARQEGSDFNDYLGVPWTYPSGMDEPEADELGSLDCSGFVRMVFGYRLHLAMTLDIDGTELPRVSASMLASAPGVVTVPDIGRVPSTRRLAPGDLLFFDADSSNGTAVDHVGIYLGRDDHGAPRFVSSRAGVDGPTMGDVGGRSLLSGTGTYALTWRAARRL